MNNANDASFFLFSQRFYNLLELFAMSDWDDDDVPTLKPVLPQVQENSTGWDDDVITTPKPATVNEWGDVCK